ncbi:nicotinate phosphoribosyltransferase [Halobacteriales archaeon QS_8_69_26]|nr:MAG: nicotinate phosphoribosyltransferase [Halobacteriales archaeon QS_8_69_26]
MSGFDVIPTGAIEEGTATDAYFLRTEETMREAGRNPHVTAEVTLGQFPSGEFSAFAGVADVAELLSGLDVDADALREGQLFDGGPVLRIEGPYLKFARFETSLLGFCSQASGFATRALEARVAAPDRLVLSFGARHVHPSIASVVERSALLAGLDGFSHVAAGEVLDREPGGTMPHALLICFGKGNQEAAWRDFDEAVGPEVPRIALCDTFDDEADEAVRAAEAVEDLSGVRLDTTGSRRGDFAHIVREVRWELDGAGHEDVEIFCSGGITPETMRELRPWADGFGVGSYITDADPLDFGMDIVEVEGDSVGKRGRLPGAKEAYRTADGAHEVRRAADGAPDGGRRLLEPLVRDGEVVREFDLDAAADRALADAREVDFRDVARERLTGVRD